MSVPHNPSLINPLKKLEMEPEGSGLRFVSAKDLEHDPYVFIALEQAERHGAAAVYFRFPSDDSPPKPTVFIFDRTEKFLLDKDEAKKIHVNLWNAGLVPLCFIISPVEITVFNCLEKPADKNGILFRPFDIIDLTAKVEDELLQKYSGKLFDSGLFWDAPEGKMFDSGNSAYEQLLKQLKIVKAKLIEKHPEVSASTIKRLLVMLILVKYLEDRKDEKGRSALDSDQFFKEFAKGENTLAGVLRNDFACLEMFKTLGSKNHFNGQVFDLNEIEEKEVKRIDLGLFAKFVDGDISFMRDGGGVGQLQLWRLFSFNHLPIELISHIYEDFLVNEDGKKKKGVVYTPPALVQFLVDQTLPLSPNNRNYPKVLDPACGSGIFLVGIYKRLIQRWRQNHNWKRPTVGDISELQSLLKDSIYGCDIEEDAVMLSYFSLSLALLDSLSPTEIFGKVHFENLVGKNLIVGDFFEAIYKKQLPVDFDLILGNPPFKLEFTDWAKEVEEREIFEFKEKERPIVPRRQIALLFLEQCIKLLNEKGKCCLLIPASDFIYNSKSNKFRNYLFSRFKLETVFDFTPLRRKLFSSSSSGAKPATVAVIAQNCEDREKPVNHIIIRWTQASGERIGFETDYYDIYNIPYSTVLQNPHTWQTNFMGGGRLHALVERLRGSKSLGEFLKLKKEENGWVFGVGWKERPDFEPILKANMLSEKENLTEEESIELRYLAEKYSAPWITNKKYVDANDFDANGISKIDVCKLRFFERRKEDQKSIFAPPHLLLKANAASKAIPVEFRGDYITFRDSLIGIHCPPEDEEDLKMIGSFLKEEITYSLIWITSGRIITNREGVALWKDIQSIPYLKGDVMFTSNEKILLKDIRDHYVSFRIEGEKSHVLHQIESEKDSLLINFGIDYCRILNSVYKDFRPLEPIVGNSFICYPFCFGDSPEISIGRTIEEIESKLVKQLNLKYSHNLWIKRIIRVFDKNVIYLYKPNQIRYWLRSIAFKDADETFVNLIEQGY